MKCRLIVLMLSLLWLFGCERHECDRQVTKPANVDSFQLLRRVEAGEIGKGEVIRFVGQYDKRGIVSIWANPWVPTEEHWGLLRSEPGSPPLPWVHAPILQVWLATGEMKKLETIHKGCPILLEATVDEMDRGLNVIFFDDGKILPWNDPGHG